MSNVCVPVEKWVGGWTRYNAKYLPYCQHYNADEEVLVFHLGYKLLSGF